MSRVKRNWRNWDLNSTPSQQDGDGGGSNRKVAPSPSSFSTQTFKVRKSYSPSPKGKGIYTKHTNKFNYKNLLTVAKMNNPDEVEHTVFRDRKMLRWSNDSEKIARQKNNRHEELKNEVKSGGRKRKKVNTSAEEKLFELDMSVLRKRRLANALSVVVGKVAEDKSGEPTIGDDEWNIDELLYRTITRRNINSCKQSRERERVVLILDTSPSCSEEASFYMDIAKSAVHLNDLEMYDAPNARIVKEYDMHKNKFVSIPSEVGAVMSKWQLFKNRTIIFFGDYDGTNIVSDASKCNSVYWLNPDLERYRSMHADKVFKGKLFACTSEKDFMRLVRKIK